MEKTGINQLCSCLRYILVLCYRDRPPERRYECCFYIHSLQMADRQMNVLSFPI